MTNLFHYRMKVEIERRRRILVAVAAYAYEIKNSPVISDGHFDAECRLVDPSIDTGRPELDHFFRTEFNPCTGAWIHRHPELEKVAELYNKWYKC